MPANQKTRDLMAITGVKIFNPFDTLPFKYIINETSVNILSKNRI